MLKVGLTGGIATGKTYVRDRFERLGIPTIDADRLAHEALGGDTALARRVAQRFGEDLLTPEGIDRKRLGAIVFADPVARWDLEGLVHPAVYERIAGWYAGLSPGCGAAFAVADIPLLYETSHAAEFDRVIVTACDPEEQVRRIVARDGISELQARQRLEAQWPSEEKVKRADYVIWTTGTFEETDRQVKHVYDELVEQVKS